MPGTNNSKKKEGGEKAEEETRKTKLEHSEKNSGTPEMGHMQTNNAGRRTETKDETTAPPLSRGCPLSHVPRRLQNSVVHYHINTKKEGNERQLRRGRKNE